MSSWKVHLLMVLTMAAMLIAISVSAMADDVFDDHRFRPFGIGTSDAVIGVDHKVRII